MKKNGYFRNIAGVLVFFAFWNCSTDPERNKCQPSAGKSMDLLYPIGGETLKLGDSITIKWRLDVQEITGTLISASLDGEEWSPLQFEEESYEIEKGRYQCGEMIWKVGDGIPTPILTPAKVIFRLDDYAFLFPSSQSGEFTITE